MKNDGYITIGTKLDTTDLEKGIKKAEAELKRLDREAQSLTKQKAKAEDNLVEAYKGMQYLEEEFEQNKKLVNSQEELNMLLKEQEKLRSIANVGLEAYKQEYDDINKKIKDNASSQDEVNESIKEMNAELQKKQGIDTLKSSIDSISGKMGGIIKNAIRWGLAIFSVTSALNFVRNSMSTLSQYNQKMAIDIEYIRWAVAMTLKPVIEFIIKLAYQLLGILRKIILTLFHYDIFAKAGADAFRKAKQSTGGIDNNLGKSVKKAKELNKQLASFDEMNILGDNTKVAGDTGTTGGSTSGGTNIPMPSYSLDDMIKPIDWDKIIDGVKIGIGNIGRAIKDKWDEIKENLENSKNPLAKPVANWMDGVEKSVEKWLDGLGDIWGGLTDIVEALFSDEDIDWDKVSEGLEKVGKGIGELIWAGILLWFNTTNLIVELGKAIGKSLIKHIITGIKEKGEKLLEDTASWIASKLTGQKVTIKWGDLKSGLGDAIKKIKEKLNKLKEDIGKIFKKIGTKVGEAFKSAFKTIFNKLVSSIESRLNTPINAINSMIGVINKLLPKKKELKKLNRISLPKLAKGGIVNMPTRGVPVGTAIAGERGAEGVIPLTDSQQMALLGEAIGKYITINANITNNMNGRVISRELQKIQNDNNFAYNR